MSTKAQNRQIVLGQPDPRFNVRAESHFSTLGGWENYFFTVENKTSREYRMVIKVDMELACVGRKSFTIGVNGTVHLPPNGVFKPSQDYDHTVNSPDSKNFKDCRLPDNAGGFTLVKSVSYTISDVQDLTQIAENKASSEKAAAQKANAVSQTTATSNTVRTTQTNASAAGHPATTGTPTTATTSNSGSKTGTVNNNQPQQAPPTEAQRQVETARTLAEIERQRNEKQAEVQKMSDAITSTGTMFGDAIRADAAAKAAREERQERLDALDRQKGSLIYQQNIEKAQTGDETAISQIIYAQRLMGYGFEDFATQMVTKFNSSTARTALIGHYKSIMSGYKAESKAHLSKGIGFLVLTGLGTAGLMYLSNEAIENDGVNSSDSDTYTYAAAGVAIVGTIVSIAQFGKVGYKYKPGYLNAESKLRKLESAQTLSFAPVYNLRNNTVGVALRLNF
ncbi:hypothetical protein [Mucilaginibacter boryungensis]